MTKNNAFQCSPHNIPVTSEDKSFMNESINVIINGNKAIAYDFPHFHSHITPSCPVDEGGIMMEKSTYIQILSELFYYNSNGSILHMISAKASG